MNVQYDVLGFPIFNENIKFEFKLDKNLIQEIDKVQFLECIKQLQKAIKNGSVDKSIFTKKQLKQIDEGEVNISGLRWHYHQVTGKIQLVDAFIHDFAGHLGGRELWAGGLK